MCAHNNNIFFCNYMYWEVQKYFWTLITRQFSVCLSKCLQSKSLRCKASNESMPSGIFYMSIRTICLLAAAHFLMLNIKDRGTSCTCWWRQGLTDNFSSTRDQPVECTPCHPTLSLVIPVLLRDQGQWFHIQM